MNEEDIKTLDEIMEEGFIEESAISIIEANDLEMESADEVPLTDDYDWIGVQGQV